MRQYSEVDPGMVAGQILPKINFVTHAWPDIETIREVRWLARKEIRVRSLKRGTEVVCQER